MALGGGVFQNRVLMDELVPALEAAGRQVLTSETLPLNDGGIAAGQLWFAIHHLATHQPVTTGCATLSGPEIHVSIHPLSGGATAPRR